MRFKLPFCVTNSNRKKTNFWKHCFDAINTGCGTPYALFDWLRITAPLSTGDFWMVALCYGMTSTRAVSVQWAVCFPVTLTCSSGERNMFVLVVTVVLSVSFCLSDGCEGQSLLAVSQNGLSLSLASLFSGICRLDCWARLNSYYTVYCGGGKLMAPLQTILPVKLEDTSALIIYRLKLILWSLFDHTEWFSSNNSINTTFNTLKTH